MLINPLDSNPFRLDQRMLEDAGLTRLNGEIVQAREDGQRHVVVLRMSWLARVVESLRGAAPVRFSF